MAVNRHLSREYALKTIFSWESMERRADLHTYLEPNNEHFYHQESDELTFVQLIVHGIEKNLKKIEETITTYAPDWPLDKIAMIDRCILYVGVFELMYNDEVPGVVAINEAVELAKKYGNDTSSKFVNGVLNTVYHKHVKADEETNKK